MSHSLGAIKFADGEIWYYEYNGTCDVIVSHIYPTSQQVDVNWRNHEWIKECICGSEEDVEIFSDYTLKYTYGKACRKCLNVSGNHYHDDTYMGFYWWETWNGADDWVLSLPGFEYYKKAKNKVA